MLRSKRHKNLINEDFAVFIPYKAGLPNLRVYFSELWSRKDFIHELARSEMRAEFSTSLIGQLWVVLNPLFMAGIYYVLIIALSGGSISGPDRFLHLLGCLFAFQFLSSAVSGGTGSLLRASGLVSNLNFPRLLLPTTAVLSSLRRFFPMMIVYFVFHALFRFPVGVNTLLTIPALALLVLTASGLGSLFATLQVYFRDTQMFLQYLFRILLYASPVLYTADAIVGSRFAFLTIANPLFSMFTVWGNSLTHNVSSTATQWLIATIWAFSLFMFGTYAFLVRERDFVVRL